MLMPKRVKRRRVHRGRMTGKCTKGNKIAYGEYGFAEAHTTFGVIGIKCWIYKGEVIGASNKKKVEGGEA